MNIQKAKTEIIHTVKAYLAKDEYGAYRIPEMRQRPILLMGPPGIGKTQIMTQVAHECDIALVSYTMTHHTRQSAMGLPYIVQKKIGGRECSVTEYTMSEIIAAVYDKMETTGLKEGILFMDEINCVSETLAPTMLQFLQMKRFGNQKLPSGWIIVAAGNPPEYNKSVREFDMVTLDRVKKISIKPCYDVWRAYAYEVGIHDAILSYLQIKPQNFYKAETTVDGMQFVTARGWEDLSELLYVYEDMDISVDADITAEYLQCPDIAKDFANYLDLYRKYRHDYSIDGIIKGDFHNIFYRRLSDAPFDEKLSVIGLLVSAVSSRCRTALDDELYAEELHDILMYVRDAAAAGASVVSRLGLVYDDRENTFEADQKEGNTPEREILIQRRLLMTLRSYIENMEDSGHDNFEEVRCFFASERQALDTVINTASAALDNAFSFIEMTFGDSQEMVVFVTEMSINPDTVRFIAEYGCDKYDIYNRRLLTSVTEREILNDIKNLR